MKTCWKRDLYVSMPQIRKLDAKDLNKYFHFFALKKNRYSTNVRFAWSFNDPWIMILD